MNINQKEFDYTGYEVVHKEYFSHIYDPSITFYRNKVNVNCASLKCLPDTAAVQTLINTASKTLVLKPCKPYAKDSLIWCSGKISSRKPRYISCPLFSEKLFDLMKWNTNYKYKMIGTFISTEKEYILLFDLDSAEAFDTTNMTNLGTLPQSWNNRFGIEAKAHDNIIQSNFLDKDYSIAVENDERK